MGNKLVLLVIDNSFSMRAGSRLADAKRAALGVLDHKESGDPRASHDARIAASRTDGPDPGNR